jgi:hypothetical protein
MTSTREDSMNTLELYSILAVEALLLCVTAIRSWLRGVRPRRRVQWVQVFGPGILLILTTFAVLNLLTHPNQIQPVSAFAFWVGFILALAIFLFFVRLVVNMGKSIRQLGR